MVNLDPIRAASSEQLVRWLRDATAAQSIRLPDTSAREHAADVAWLDTFTHAIRVELARRSGTMRDRRPAARTTGTLS